MLYHFDHEIEVQIYDEKVLRAKLITIKDMELATLLKNLDLYKYKDLICFPTQDGSIKFDNYIIKKLPRQSINCVRIDIK